MKVIALLFPGLTFLDFIGFYDCVTRLKTMGFLSDLELDIGSFSSSQIGDDRDHNLSLNIPHVKPKLSKYDMIFVPGGFGTRTLIKDEEFLSWFREEAKDVPYKVSVCTGSLVFGAAGFLKDKRATTHPNAFEELSPFVKEVIRNERIVHEKEVGRNVITGGGVSTSIDLGLYICELLAGKEARERIQRQLDYPYYNPNNNARSTTIQV
jgi:transcriptional regulator GlxA family with amidase domain